jgi:hypothetical protein
VTTFPDEEPMAAPYTQYNRRVRVTDCAAGCGGVADADMRQIVVTVDYRPMTATGVAAAAQRKGAVVSMYLSRR